MPVFGAFLAYFVVASSNHAGETSTINFLHINDHHSHIDPSLSTLVLDGREYVLETGGFPRVVAQFDKLATELENVVKLHAGDAITGSIYYSMFKGEADARFMNLVCFDVFALGNHEFDDGDDGLARFIEQLNGADSKCNTSIVAANVRPAPGTPLADSRLAALRPYVVIDMDGERVGIIGIDVAGKTRNSSSPLPTTLFLDEHETAQNYIDQLLSAGVNKIVLLTHVQHLTDLKMAGSLRGVDVIVGGDSHTLLGESFADIGLQPTGPYPVVTTNADGDRVCVAQAWQYSQLVGHLSVTFDQAGRVIECGGAPYLLLGSQFEKVGEDGEKLPLEDEELDELKHWLEAKPELSIIDSAPRAEALRQEYLARIGPTKTRSIGVAERNLCLERIPGQGRSALCDCVENARHGGDVQQLVAHAFLQRSFEAEIAIQNAGGVRIDLAKGDITYGDVYELLPFSNTLVNLAMNGREIESALEEAMSYILDQQGSTGAYPYAAGLRWRMDLAAPQYKRLSQIEFKGKSADTWEPLDPDRTYTVVTNGFLAGGRDEKASCGALRR